MFSRTVIKTITGSRPCKRCGYNRYSKKLESLDQLPGGLSSAMLLDNSPSPQLLLSEGNIVIYANTAATRLLLPIDPLLELEDIDPESGMPTRRTTDMFEPPSQGKSTKRNSVFSATSKRSVPPSITGITGRSIEDLGIELAREDVRRWISLTQVLENVRSILRKQAIRKKHKDKEEGYANFYAPGFGNTDYDYYGDLERGNEDDREIESIPVVITQKSGRLLHAALCVSILVTGGREHTALSLVPTFEDPKAHGKKKGGRKKDHNTYVTSGKHGADVIERVGRLKDLVLDEMEYAFMALTPDGDIVISNKATKAVLGADNLEASIGEGFDWISRLNIYRPDFSEPLPFEEWALNTLITKNESVSQMIGMYLGDVPLILELKGKPLWENPEKEEGLIAALCVVVNQTEWATREQGIKKSDNIKKVFLANIEHELKTPVAGMIGLLEILYTAGGGLDDEQKPFVHQLYSAINSLLIVINDVIDFNKIQSGDLTVVNEPFILQHLVSDVQTLFSGSMAKDGVNFELDMSGVSESSFGDGKKLLLLGDDGKIRRVLINMLSNAVKFTSKGTVKLSVITQNFQGDMLELKFEITDTGIGISESDIQKLLRPFEETIGEDLPSGHPVTGFGLNIAKSFTSLLGGEIGCNSRLDQGSTFWFTVPCSRPPLHSEVKFPESSTLMRTMGLVIRPGELDTGAGKKEETKKKNIDIKGTNILLVEDNWSQQVVTAKKLEKLGCNVCVAINGQNALAILRNGETKVDIVFMDLQMSLLDGFETTVFIRTTEDPALIPFKDVPIIAVTANESKGDRQKAIESGLSDFTLKPLQIATLREFIEMFMDPEVRVKSRRDTTKYLSGDQTPTEPAKLTGQVEASEPPPAQPKSIEV